MILAFLIGGAAFALVGTRVSAVAFAAAAVASAVTLDGHAAAIGTWTGAMATALVLAGLPVRRLALPVAGAAGVLLALAAPNAAIVLPAWLAASAAAVLAGDGAGAHRRWAFGVLLADVPVAVGIAWAAADGGFLPWPHPLGVVPAVLVGVAAAIKVSLAAGPFERAPEAGLLVVRTQALVLIALLGPPLGVIGGGSAVARGAGGGSATLLAIAGAALFVAGASSERAGIRDGIQELGLAAVAVGIVADGWLWGVLAAGTLLHALRVAGRGSTPATRTSWDALRSGGIGALFLPAVAALGTAAVTRGSPEDAAIVAGLVAGMAGRARAVGGRDAPGVRWGPGPRMRTVLLVAAGAVALWGPLGLLGPPWPARSVLGFLWAQDAPWPAVWTLGVLATGGVAGAVFARHLAPGRTRRPPGPPAVPTVLRTPARVLGLAARRGALVVPAAVLALAAAGVWVLGIVRGFL